MFLEKVTLNRIPSFSYCFLPFILIVFSCFAESGNYIGIQRFSISSPAISYYQSIDVLLFQRLNFELLPNGIKPMVVGDTIPKECMAIIGGTIDLVDSVPVLVFKISGTGSTDNDEETKRFSLLDQPIDAIVDILTLKIRHFLEQNITGKLRISSSPLDCDIFLNGIRIGSTPAELILEKGDYSVELRRLYFAPFKKSVSITPGRENELLAPMRFMGTNTQPWFVSALFFTAGTVTAQLLELHYRDEYLSSSVLNFNMLYGRYQAANITKISLSIPAVVSWIITAHHAKENRTIKKEIFGEK